jgi:hypothetical protein
LRAWILAAMEELLVSASERKLAQEAATAAAAAGVTPDYAPFSSAIEKKEYAQRQWAHICSWASSTDVGSNATRQPSCTVIVDPSLVDADISEEWQKTLSAKGFVTEIKGRVMAVRLPE